MKRLIGALVLVAAGSANAAVTLSQFPPNPGVLPAGGWQFTSGTTFANPTPPRAWVNGVYGGVPSATVSDAVTISGRAGALAVTARTTVSAVEVALALGRLAGGAGAVLAAGSLAYDLLQSAGVRQGPSGPLVDPGADPIQTSVIEYGVGDGSFLSPLAAACGAVAAFRTNPYDVWKFVSSRVGSGGDAYCSLIATDRTTGNVVDSREFQMTTRVNTSGKSCAPIVDSSSGQTYVPGTRDDGKCITGRYEAPSSPSQVAGLIQSAVNGNVAQGAKAVVSAGQSIPAADFKVEGPASQTGTPATTSTTSTAPNGVVTTTNTTNTPVYNYTYAGDTININNSTITTTTTNVGGNVTTTETKSDVPADSQCKEFPNSLACLQLGELQDSPITPVQKSITVGQESIDLPSGCPADIALPGGRVISYATACDSAVKMAPLVIAAGVLSALLIAVAAIRSN